MDNKLSYLNQKHTEKHGIFFKINRDKYLLLMLLPGLLYYVIFKYLPMYGVVIAFKEYNIFRGISASPWVGLEHFMNFFQGSSVYRLIRNTLIINIYGLIFGFPAPVILALAFNELKGKYFKKTSQAISLLPHFISTVVIAGLVKNFLSPTTGIINRAIQLATGADPINFFMNPQYFRSIYISMDLWKSVGWGSIIFSAALSGIDPSLYEASFIDGANKLKQAIYITIPGLLPTIVIVLILRLGDMLDVGAQSIILLYNPMIYETADVLSTYVYRRGLVGADYSFGAAVDLFQSTIGIILIVSANYISRRMTESSLW